MSENSPLMWTQAEAISIASIFEQIAPQFGCHVALTGGCLYKFGERKDCDLVIYRIRQVPEINIQGLLEALTKYGVELMSDHSFCKKCRWMGRTLDLLFPEFVGGDYGDDEGEEGA